MQYSSRINKLPRYVLGEIAATVAKARALDRDVIDLSQINPNLEPPAEAIDKLVQATLRKQNHRYSSSQGITRLRESICGLYKEDFDVVLDPSRNVVVTMGIKEGVGHLLLAILEPGDKVIISTPAYPVHVAAVCIAGGEFVGCPLFSQHELLSEETQEKYLFTEKSNGFFERLEHLLKSEHPRPKAMILNFPHNPTTASVTTGFFDRLVSIAREYELILIHDFAYGDLCFDGYKAPSLLQSAGLKDLAVEFYSMSKGFNLPGWRVGFCSGNELLAGALKKIKSYYDFGIFQPIQIASISALKKRADIVSEAAHIYKSRRDMLCAGLRKMSWECALPHSTLFLWARIPEKFQASGSVALANRMLEEADVAVCPGAGFSPDADSYMRFALVEPEYRIQSALERLGKSF